MLHFTNISNLLWIYIFKLHSIQLFFLARTFTPYMVSVFNSMPFSPAYCLQYKPLLILIYSYSFYSFEFSSMNCHPLGKGTTSFNLSQTSTPQTIEIINFLGHYQYKLHIFVQWLFWWNYQSRGNTETG